LVREIFGEDMHVRIISAGHPGKPEENIVKKSPHLNIMQEPGQKKCNTYQEAY
jgi:hypothetical protein